MKRIARIVTAFWALIYWRAKPKPANPQKPSWAMAPDKIEFASLTPLPLLDTDRTQRLLNEEPPPVQPTHTQSGKRQAIILSDFGISFEFRGKLFDELYRNPMSQPTDPRRPAKNLPLPVMPNNDPVLN